MKTNLIIASYGGLPQKHDVNPYKKYYLRLNLQCLNKLSTDITRITIMKPSVESGHKIVDDYYDFSCMDIENIRDKITIYECDNIGISYGQYFAGISHNMDCDYHFWIEDDYIICGEYFERVLYNILWGYPDHTHLCPFIYTNKKWDIIPYAHLVNETQENIDKTSSILQKYGAINLICHVPDMMQLGVLSSKCVNKILERFGTFKDVYDFFDVKFTKIWLHQILFGYVLNLSGIELRDTARLIMNIFYETSPDKMYLCNFPENVMTWKERPYNNELFGTPLCIPLDIAVYPDRYEEDVELMKNYVDNQEGFNKQYHKYLGIIKDTLSTLTQDVQIRQLVPSDHKDYLELMKEFTNYEYNTSLAEFTHYITHHKDDVKTFVAYSQETMRIIGAGSIFCMRKLHNNPVGQIEDVFIQEPYRSKGLGKILINRLVDIGKNFFKCYKVILKSHNETIPFYEKSGFSVSGVELKQ